MRHAAWILGFHGCDRAIGEAILAGQKEIVQSRNEYDWLGSGAYFWENSYSRAWDWANFLASNRTPVRRRIKAPFVIGAIVDPGNCLDLSEAGCLEILKERHAKLVHAFADLGLDLPRNEAANSSDDDLVKRKLDCAVINALHQNRELNGETPFDTVRCPFIEGGPLFDGSKIYAKTHIQWCVRAPRKSILGYFRARKETS